jgi:hypothetical protein
METEDPLPFSQQPASEHNPEPDESGTYSHTLFLQDQLLGVLHTLA